MDAQLLPKDRIRRTSQFKNLTVNVIENPDYSPGDDHQCLIRITVIDDDGDPDRMLEICPCCARTLARIIEKASDGAASIEEGTKI